MAHLRLRLSLLQFWRDLPHGLRFSRQLVSGGHDASTGNLSGPIERRLILSAADRAQLVNYLAVMRRAILHFEVDGRRRRTHHVTIMVEVDDGLVGRDSVLLYFTFAIGRYFPVVAQELAQLLVLLAPKFHAG